MYNYLKTYSATPIRIDPLSLLGSNVLIYINQDCTVLFISIVYGFNTHGIKTHGLL